MGRVDGPRDLDEEPDAPTHVEPPVVAPAVDRDAVDELHDEVVEAVDLAEVVDAHDARMVEAGQRARFITGGADRIDRGLGHVNLGRALDKAGCEAFGDAT